MMKSVIFSIAAFAAAVSAQTTTTTAASSTATCLAQPILDQCLITTQGYLELCQSTDYSCLCDKYTSILTCYNNCPNDPGVFGASQQKQLNCANASIYSSLSAATATGSSTSGTAAATTTAATTTTSHTSATGTGSSTASAATTSKTNGAGELVASSGMLAAVAGAVVALL